MKKSLSRKFEEFLLNFKGRSHIGRMIMLELLAQSLLIILRRDRLPPQRNLYVSGKCFLDRRDRHGGIGDIPEWELR